MAVGRWFGEGCSDSGSTERAGSAPSILPVELAAELEKEGKREEISTLDNRERTGGDDERSRRELLRHLEGQKGQ